MQRDHSSVQAFTAQGAKSEEAVGPSTSFATHTQEAIPHRYSVYAMCMIYRSLWQHKRLPHKLRSPKAYLTESGHFPHSNAIFICKAGSLTLAISFHEAVVSRMPRKHPACHTDFMLTLFLVHLEYLQPSIASGIILVIILFNYLQFHATVGIKVHNQEEATLAQSLGRAKKQLSYIPCFSSAC